MKQLFYTGAVCLFALASCTTPFKKAKDGTQYKIISNAKGALIVKDNWIEMDAKAMYKDSVLMSTIEDGMPQFAPYDTAQYPEPYKQIFKQIRVGDSVVIRISTDSLIAKGQNAPFMQKGQFIVQTYKIANVYATVAQKDSAQQTHMKVAKERYNAKLLASAEKDLLAKKNIIDADSKKIEEYLTKNNLKANKTKWGTYVVINTEGTGNVLSSKDVVQVNYTGRTFDSSKVFDSNIDPKFKHVEPIDVNLGTIEGIILAWTDALKTMKKGTKATIYVPSTLGYGEQGRGAEIKPNDILVFDMEVLGTISEEAYSAKQQQQQQMQQMIQQQLQQQQPQQQQQQGNK